MANEIARADHPDMDYAQHKRTYDGFVRGSQITIVLLVLRLRLRAFRSTHRRLRLDAECVHAVIATFGRDVVVAHLVRALGIVERAEALRLDTREGLFETFLGLHPKLKERYFLNTKEHDSDPYESSQFSIVLAGPAGIFGVESYREVFEFDRFWAIGSGRRFALGAMHAVFDRARSAREVATAGVLAGCEFDTSSAGPVHVQTYKLKHKT